MCFFFFVGGGGGGFRVLPGLRLRVRGFFRVFKRFRGSSGFSGTLRFCRVWGGLGGLGLSVLPREPNTP